MTQIVSSKNPIFLLSLDTETLQSNQGQNSLANFSLPNPISTNDEHLVGQYALTSFTAKNVFYNVTIYNQNFSITTVYTSQGNQLSITYPFTIPVGYYDITTLIEWLNVNVPQTITIDSTAYNSCFGGPLVDGVLTYPAFSYSSVSGKISINIYQANFSSNFTDFYINSITLNFSNDNYEFFQLIGLCINKNIPYTSIYVKPVSFIFTTVLGSYTQIQVTYGTNSGLYSATDNTIFSIIGNYLVDLNPIQKLYVNINSGGAATNRAPYNEYNPGPYLVGIPVTSGYGLLFSYNPPILHYINFTNMQFGSFNIEIVDANQRPIDFNGTNWQMDIIFQYSYSEEYLEILETDKYARASHDTDMIARLPYSNPYRNPLHVPAESTGTGKFGIKRKKQ